MGAPFVFACLLPPDGENLRRFVDLWLSLQAGNGFRAAQIDYRIRGEPRASRRPRWNLIDYVLRPALAGRYSRYFFRAVTTNMRSISSRGASYSMRLLMPHTPRSPHL